MHRPILANTVQNHSSFYIYIYASQKKAQQVNDEPFYFDYFYANLSQLALLTEYYSAVTFSRNLMFNSRNCLVATIPGAWVITQAAL